MDQQELKNRLDVLLEQDVITNQAYSVTTAAYDKTADILNTDQIEQGEMLFTHLSMALTRLANGDQVEGPDMAIMKEVSQSENFTKAKRLLKFVEQTWGDELPEEEKNFLNMHFTNILNINEGARQQ